MIQSALNTYFNYIYLGGSAKTAIIQLVKEWNAEERGVAV